MTVNVRCVAVIVKGVRAEQIGTVETVAVPCGWKGERSPFGHFDDDTLRYGVNLTAPCPRCGGRVELIPQEP